MEGANTLVGNILRGYVYTKITMWFVVVGVFFCFFFFKYQKDCLIALPFLRGNSKVNSSKKFGFAFALQITELLELW